MTTQAFITHTTIRTAAFTAAPAKEQREWLIAEGFRYEKGRWTKSQSDTAIVDAQDAAKVLTVSA